MGNSNLELDILTLLAVRRYDEPFLDERDMAGTLGEEEDNIHYACSELEAKGRIYHLEGDLAGSWGITKEGALSIDKIKSSEIKEKKDSKHLELQSKSIDYQKYGVIIAVITGITAMIISIITAMK